MSHHLVDLPGLPQMVEGYKKEQEMQALFNHLLALCLKFLIGQSVSHGQAHSLYERGLQNLGPLNFDSIMMKIIITRCNNMDFYLIM